MSYRSYQKPQKSQGSGLEKFFGMLELGHDRGRLGASTGKRGDVLEKLNDDGDGS